MLTIEPEEIVIVSVCLLDIRLFLASGYAPANTLPALALKEEDPAIKATESSSSIISDRPATALLMPATAFPVCTTDDG